jgi:hypothetical protein
LYLALPEDYISQAKKNSLEIAHYLNTIARNIGKKEISSWNLEDGSLERHIDDLQKLGKNDDAPTHAIYLVGKAFERYKNDLQHLDFLKTDYLPTLKQLEEGAKPTPLMQGVIEIALHNCSSMFFRLYSDSLSDEEPLSMIHLGGFETDSRNFLVNLRKEITKVTGIKRVMDFSSEHARTQ